MVLSETGWRSINDPAQRRKLQNRLNQRLSRQRKAQGDRDVGGLIVKQWGARTPGGRKASTTPQTVNSSEEESRNSMLLSIRCTPQNEGKHEHSQDPSTPIRDDGTWTSFRTQPLNPQQDDLIICEHDRHAKDCLAQRRNHVPSPEDHRLLTLIYYNLFRGLNWNVDILGLDNDRIMQDDCPSPFIPLSPTANSKITKLPASLRPTMMQKTIDHHPFLDIFPCPVVRDNILKLDMKTTEQDELCHDILGFSEDGRDWLVCGAEEAARTGVTLWGDPWDISNWEVSEYMAVKWKRMFVGATELLVSTNVRRRRRGWKEISFA